MITIKEHGNGTSVELEGTILDLIAESAMIVNHVTSVLVIKDAEEFIQPYGKVLERSIRKAISDGEEERG